MRGLTILSLIGATAGIAQFSSLASNHDRSEVLFVTTLRERGSNLERSSD